MNDRRLKFLFAFSAVVVISFVLQSIWPGSASADIALWEDKLLVTGFYRMEFALHTGSENPNNSTVQEDNNRVNLFNNIFQTEWTFKASPTLSLYAKIRLSGDFTDQVDSTLHYNAYPLGHTGNGSNGTLMKSDGSNYALEAWELYADLKMGDLWLRLGRQQIVWGEMIAARILDIVNPLDYSMHFINEPEEYENIRVPEFAIRGSYSFERPILGIQSSIEGFLNPGDWVPTTNPALGGSV